MKSCIGQRPFIHGYNDEPSGRLPSSRASDTSSRRDRISADESARLTHSLFVNRLWLDEVVNCVLCRNNRPADLRQLSPCVPISSTKLPQMQSYGVQIGAPSRRATAVAYVSMSCQVHAGYQLPSEEQYRTYLKESPGMRHCSRKEASFAHLIRITLTISIACYAVICLFV
jgi:hypothetical protein